MDAKDIANNGDDRFERLSARPSHVEGHFREKLLKPIQLMNVAFPWDAYTHDSETSNCQRGETRLE